MTRSLCPKRRFFLAAARPILPFRQPSQSRRTLQIQHIGRALAVLTVKPRHGSSAACSIPRWLARCRPSHIDSCNEHPMQPPPTRPGSRKQDNSQCRWRSMPLGHSCLIFEDSRNKYSVERLIQTCAIRRLKAVNSASASQRLLRGLGS